MHLVGSHKGIFLNIILCAYSPPPHPCLHLLGIGWRAAIRPADHPVANFEFDVVVGADGRRNTLDGEKTVTPADIQYMFRTFIHLCVQL